MASSAAMKTTFLLLLTLFTSLHTTRARDSQFFNKASTTAADEDTANTINPTKEEALNNNQQQEPDFQPETESRHGLYGHESGQNPPSTETPAVTESTEPVHKYLPKNYNPVAYVTVPEDASDSASLSDNTVTENLNNDDNVERYYNNDRPQEFQTGESQYRSFSDNAAVTIANNGYDPNYNYRYNSEPVGQSDTRFTSNSEPVGMSDTRFTTYDAAALNRRGNYFDGGVGNRIRPQGMSDTRFLENGKYYFDVNINQYSENHPYQSLKTMNLEGNGNYYGNRENSGYQKQYEFEDEESLP